MPRFTFTTLSAAYVLLAASSAHAVVVALDNTSTYTLAPSDNFGFGNVAIVDDRSAGIPASGVYLGNGWMITAYHVLTDGGSGFQFGGISLQGSSYSADPSTATRLHNSDNSVTDLAMFRLTTIPVGVPSVTLSLAAPLPGSSIVMMGNGQDRDLNETTWDSSWVEGGHPTAFTGYHLIGSRALRWGTNNVETTPVTIGDSFGNFRGYYSDWDRVLGEAQATTGDSGGGVFYKNGLNWELSGIMLGVQSITNQPGGTVVYNTTERTFAANIADYRTEIVATMNTVPEPSAAIFSLTGLALAAQKRRRRATRA